MKKILKLITICAASVLAVCCTNTKSVSAEEVNLNYSYSDNLYSGINWRIDDNESENLSIDIDFTGSTDDPIVTNFINIEDKEKDLVVIMKFKIPSLTYNENSFISFGVDKTLFIFLNEDLEKIGGAYPSSKLSRLTVEGDTVTIYALIANPTTFNSNAKYFTISPKLLYKDANDNNILLNGKYIEEMRVSYTGKVNPDDYAWLTRVEGDLYRLDLTSYDSEFEFNTGEYTMENNYIPASVLANVTIEDVLSKITINDKHGERCAVKYGSFLPEQIHVNGGKYDYICVAYDKEGNEESFVVSLNIVDMTPPTISGAFEFNVPVGSKLSISTIKNSLIVSDNFDNPEDITITTKYDYYTSNYNTPGTYYVCFVARDTNGNSSEVTVKINVLDSNAPAFYDSNNTKITKYKVMKSVDSVLVLSDIVKNITAVDVVDGELDIKVYSDKYTGNGDTPGKYLVVLAAKDSSGNIAYLNVNIEVSDVLPTRTIVIDDRFILVEKNVKLSKNDFHTIISLTTGYDSTTTTYTSINTEIYNYSYNVVGDYLVDYTLVSTNGYEKEAVFTVSVIEQRSSDSFVNNKVEEEKDGIIVSILKWIWNLIVSIFNWFMGLFE